MKKILMCIILVTCPTISLSATFSKKQVTDFLLPKLNKETHETNRKKNELLKEIYVAEIKNKPDYALAFVHLDDNKPDTRPDNTQISPTSSWSSMLSNEEHNYFYEIYLLKTSPQLSIAASGFGSFEKLCDCASSEKHITISVEASTIPLGKSNVAFLVTAELPTGGMSSTWGENTYLNAFRVDGDKILHIWNALKDSSFEVSGRYEDGPSSTNTSFRFSPTKESWILQGTDENFLYGQSVPTRQVYVWDEKAQAIKEIADDERTSLLCTEAQLQKASKIAKSEQQRKKYSKAQIIIENAIEKCSDYPNFSKALWLESDLLLYMFKSEDYNNCISTAEALENRKDFNNRPKEVREAIVHNKKICIEKNKTPAL